MEDQSVTKEHRHIWMLRDFNRTRRLATQALFQRLELLDPGQPMMLFVLEHDRKKGIRPTQRELAQELDLSPATVTVSIKALLRKGYLRKLPDEDDLRKNRIEITEKGREAADKCRRAFDLLNEAMLRGFTESEIEEVSHYFARMSANLRAFAESEKEAFVP
jgi:DNA-binding MarR family transcriptional regulator